MGNPTGTNAQSAAMLLRGAASFFRNLAVQLPGSGEKMLQNAAVYELLADQVEKNPLGRSSIPLAANDDRR